MENQPLVSILMTAYNREKFLAEAIESVRAVTYPNWELIIVDDCSRDNTFSVAKRYVALDERIKLFVNEKNLGDYPNRNKAASYASGNYLVFVDSDDWILPDTLVKWVNLVEKHRLSFGIFVPGMKAEPTILSSKQAITQHFFSQPLLMSGPVATIVARDFFMSINGFPEKYGPANDMYYNLKAASCTRVLLLPFPLGGYRRHEGQEINNSYSYLYNSYRYLRDALTELHLPLNETQVAYLHEKNKRRFATNCIKFAIRPGNFK
ncbi:MAG: glycosyltransferase family 2 protein [Ginsengibacter sp.]